MRVKVTGIKAVTTEVIKTKLSNAKTKLSNAKVNNKVPGINKIPGSILKLNLLPDR